jgi:hypothetical protein
MRWRSPNNPLPAVFLGASEVTWISLILAALVTTSPNFPMDIPYFVLVVPAVAAVLLGRIARTVRGPVVLRVVATCVLGFVLIALGAGALAERTVHGVFGSVALHPWTVTGRIPSAVSTISWLAVAAVVLRGILLGLSKGSFRQVGRSAAWTAIFFFTLFVVLATDHDQRLHHATRSAGALFVVFFLLILVLGHVMRTREAAAAGITAPGGADRRVWAAILVVPVVVVVGVGLLATAALGAYGSGLTTVALDVAHGLGAAGKAVGLAFIFLLVHAALGIAEGIGKIIGLFYHGSGKTPAYHAKAASKPPKILPSPKVPAYVGGIIVAVLVGGVVTMYLRYGPRRKRPPQVVTPPEERSSLFTWSHLLRLIWASLRRMLSRLWKKLLPNRRPRGPVVVLPTGVRADYRRVLIAANAAGRPRAASETPREFATRLSPELADDAPLLAGLTDAYERARYAGFDGDAVDSSPAEELVLAFAAIAAGTTAERAAARAEASEADTGVQP